MAAEHTVPLEVEFLPDGHVRIGETVLSTEDSRKFAAQLVDIDFPNSLDRDSLDRVFVWRRFWPVTLPFADVSGRVYRGPFILVPVSVASLPAGVERADPDPFARLIERYIEPDGNPRRVEEARLRDYGYAVWALLGDILVPGRTADLIAHEYHVPVQAVEAVWAYYLRNRTALDRRLAENRAA